MDPDDSLYSDIENFDEQLGITIIPLQPTYEDLEIVETVPATQSEPPSNSFDNNTNNTFQEKTLSEIQQIEDEVIYIITNYCIIDLTNDTEDMNQVSQSSNSLQPEMTMPTTYAEAPEGDEFLKILNNIKSEPVDEDSSKKEEDNVFHNVLYELNNIKKEKQDDGFKPNKTDFIDKTKSPNESQANVEDAGEQVLDNSIPELNEDFYTNMLAFLENPETGAIDSTNDGTKVDNEVEIQNTAGPSTSAPLVHEMFVDEATNILSLKRTFEEVDEDDTPKIKLPKFE